MRIGDWFALHVIEPLDWSVERRLRISKRSGMIAGFGKWRFP